MEITPDLSRNRHAPRLHGNSSASRWHPSGMPLDLVRRMLRHRDARRYAKLADSALVEAFGATPSRADGVPVVLRVCS